MNHEVAIFDPQTVRSDFPILDHAVRPGVPLVYFDNAATTQHPRQVIQAIVETYEHDYANVHRGVYRLADRVTESYENAREKIRRFIGASAREEIVWTSGATAAVNLVARSWGDANIGPRDEILLTEMEHHSNLVPWQQLAQRTGATLRCLPVTEDGRLAMDRLDEFLGRRTRLVAVTAVSNVLGTINPIGELTRRAHEVGAVVLVDGAQSVPHLPTDVVTLDVDFLAVSGHKMLGPSGVGFLYGKRALLEAMPPFLGGGSMIERVTLEGFVPAGLPQRFEAGTPPIVPAIGLGAAIDYLEGIPREAIHGHEQRLTCRAHEVLRSIGGVRILGPEPGDKTGIVAFVVEGLHPHDIAQLLDREGVAIRAGHHCAMPLHRRWRLPATARASFYFYNTLEEIDTFAEALEKAKAVFFRRQHRQGSETSVRRLSSW